MTTKRRRPAKPAAAPRRRGASRRRPASKRRPGFRLTFGWLMRAFQALAVLLLVGLIGWVGLVYAYAPELPDTDELWRAAPQPGLTFVADDGAVLARRGAYQARIVTLEEISPFLIDAVISTEDRRFYGHFGIDPFGMARALVANLRAGGVVQGGSTLTQQLAKNLFLTHERSFDRKAKELILAVWLETRLTKREILTLYLNRVYLGAGAYGFEAAARLYFGKPAATLGLAESALLAGLLKAPSRLSPTTNLDAAHARTEIVLEAMTAAGAITTEQALVAARAPAVPVSYAEAGTSGWFLDWVGRALPPDWKARASNLVVRTTLDRELQAAAAEAVGAALEAHGATGRIGQAAVVAIDRQGRVRAMVGGDSYGRSPFNRAVDAKRQPGSAFKPVVYLAALQAGWRPEQRVVDGPVDFGGYRPTNYDNRYAGEMTLADAFVRSRNTVPVRLVEDIGRRRVIATAQLLGINGRLPVDASLALGTGETTLLELSAAYVPFVNGGRFVAPTGIVDLRTEAGTVLSEGLGEPGAPFLSGEVLRMMQGMFHGVVQRGTGKRADPGDRWVGGKTGTSQNWRDAWFVGFSHDLVVGVWVGNDDNSPMNKVTGGGVPAEVFAAIMRAAPTPAPPVPLPGRVRQEVARADPEPPSRVGDIKLTESTEDKGFFDVLLRWLGDNIEPRTQPLRSTDN
ncbi:MAG: PBP1A family penicillin-binding protein [Pseudomonadota bacterium]